MFKWLFGQNKTEEESAPESSRSGFFSTHMDMPKRRRNLEEILQFSFHKSFPKPEGHQAVAMDSNIQQVKATAANLTTRIPEEQLTWYASQGFIGYQLCAMLSQNWLIDKACTMPARDASRNGYVTTVNDGTGVSPEIIDYIAQADKRFGIIKQCEEYVRNKRIFGIRVALFEVAASDPEYYEKPFNPDGVTPGSYKGIAQIDPYWMAPILGSRAASDPSARDFYEPTWWLINGKKYHHTHLVITKRGEVPDILKPTYLYGGIPLPQQMAERVYASERTANEAPLLAMTKRLITFKMDMEMAAINSPDFTQRMEAWSSYMNNYGIKIHGEDEEVSQFDTTLNDLDQVIMTQYQLCAAQAEVPATKMMGTTPKGFNTTGEHETRSYNQFLESIQQHDLSPLVERHHLLLIRSEVAPKFNIKPFSTTTVWNSPDSPTSEEIAEINLKKSQADEAWQRAGAIDSVDVRNRIINDEDSGYAGIEEIVEGIGEGDVPPDTMNTPQEGALTSGKQVNQAQTEVG